MADSTYIIDVASEMPDAGTTTAQLDELSQSLINAGASAESLEAATLAVASQLTAAKDATRAANSALAEGNARYGELERAALKAAQAAEKAAQQGKLDPTMARAAHEAAVALETEAVALRYLEAEATRAARAEAKLSATQGNLAKLSRANASAITEQNAAARKSLSGAQALVPAAKRYEDFSRAISTSKGAAIVAAGAVVGLSVAIAAITVVTVAATAAVAGLAVSLASAKREAALTEEAISVLHPEFAALSGDFAAISEETGAGAADMRAWVKQLKTAKVAAEDIPAALRAMAMQEAALGKGGSAEFLETLRESKRAAGDLADEVNGQLGGIVAKRMRGLDAQTKRLKKNFGDLFSTLNIEPVLAGMSVLVDLFDKGTASGQAMQFLFEEIFQPIIDQATNAAYVVEAFVLGFLIGLTKLYIAVKPAIRAVKEFFGFDDTSLSDTLDIAKIAGEAVAFVFIGFVAALVAVGAAIAAAIVWVLAVPAAVAAMVAAVVYAGVAIYEGIVGVWNRVTSFLNGLVPGLGDMGSNMMKGLITGLLGAGPAVISALTGVVGSAITAAKKALGIASPSRVFADIGGFTAEGFTEGVDDGAADAQRAMADMVEPPGAGAASPYTVAGVADRVQRAPGAAAAAGGGGGKTVHIENLYLAGSKASEAEKRSLAEELTKLLEGDAAALTGEAAA